MKALCECSSSCRRRKGFGVLVWQAQTKMRKKNHFFEECWYWSGGTVNSQNLCWLSGYLVFSAFMDDTKAAHTEDRKIKGPRDEQKLQCVFHVLLSGTDFCSICMCNQHQCAWRYFATFKTLQTEKCDISYRRLCELQAATQKRRWQNRILRSRRGGSPRHRAAKRRRQWRWRWGAERRRWWQLPQRPQRYRFPPPLHPLPRYRCRRWSRCQSWRYWGSSGCPAGCASLSPPSSWVPGCCCGGRTPAMEAHLPLLWLEMAIRGG